MNPAHLFQSSAILHDSTPVLSLWLISSFPLPLSSSTPENGLDLLCFLDLVAVSQMACKLWEVTTSPFLWSTLSCPLTLFRLKVCIQMTLADFKKYVRAVFCSPFYPFTHTYTHKVTHTLTHGLMPPCTHTHTHGLTHSHTLTHTPYPWVSCPWWVGVSGGVWLLVFITLQACLGSEVSFRDAILNGYAFGQNCF